MTDLALSYLSDILEYRILSNCEVILSIRSCFFPDFGIVSWHSSLIPVMICLSLSTVNPLMLCRRFCKRRMWKSSVRLSRLIAYRSSLTSKSCHRISGERGLSIAAFNTRTWTFRRRIWAERRERCWHWESRRAEASSVGVVWMLTNVTLTLPF